MLQIHTILFPTDFSPCAEQAFSHATYLADRFEADLHILHATVQRHPERTPAPVDAEIEEAEILEELHVITRGRQKAPPSDGGQLFHAHAEDTSAADAILHYAGRHEADLIVMGTHGRHGLNRLILGSVAEAVVRRAPCPVLTVRGCDADRPDKAIRRILVPIDFSDTASYTLAYARSLAAVYGAEIDFLHVIDEAILPHVYGVEPISLSALEVKARMQQKLGRWVRTGSVDKPEAVHVLIGQPARGITDFARHHGSDLIVVGTHGRTGLKRLLLGSVCAQVVRTAPCPVFTVRPAGVPQPERSHTAAAAPA